jgi:plastocyanin
MQSQRRRDAETDAEEFKVFSACFSAPLRLCGCIFCVGLMLAMAGCDRGSVPETARAAAAGDGVIRGRVTFVGFVPVRKVIPGSPMVSDESIVTGSDQGLKNVIVYLKDAPKATFVLKAPVVLDQIKCVYVPHVVAVQTGETLRLKSSDALMHNVHLKCAVNPDANYGFPAPGQRDIQLALPEAPFAVRCDVHPWMSAWVGVFDHPWFAVTGEDGSFTIEHVPPGKYTVVAWQEVLPEQEEQITVGNGGETKVDFAFAAP